jgi:hypothetical protein
MTLLWYPEKGGFIKWSPMPMSRRTGQGKLLQFQLLSLISAYNVECFDADIEQGGECNGTGQQTNRLLYVQC